MYRSSPFPSTFNTGYITALGMCKVCTEAVHSVALWTRVTLGLGMCKVCTEAVHSEVLDMCEVCISCSVSFSAQNVSKNNPRLQMHETARPVYEMHINTRFPLGSTSAKMRANEGSEGTTTTTTTTTNNNINNNNNKTIWVLLGLCMYILQLQRDLDSISLKSRPRSPIGHHQPYPLKISCFELVAYPVESMVKTPVHPAPKYQHNGELYLSCVHTEIRNLNEWYMPLYIYTYTVCIYIYVWYIFPGHLLLHQRTPPACKVKNSIHRMCFLQCVLPSREKPPLQADRIVQTFGCWKTDGHDLHAHVTNFSQQLGALDILWYII